MERSGEGAFILPLVTTALSMGSIWWLNADNAGMKKGRRQAPGGRRSEVECGQRLGETAAISAAERATLVLQFLPGKRLLSGSQDGRIVSQPPENLLSKAQSKMGFVISNREENQKWEDGFPQGRSIDVDGSEG